jgi:prepilin signal peptidase PulO-like enzyme (type II secretory pathway)
LFSIPNWLLAATRRCNDLAVGQGDIGLLAACGAWIGPKHVILAAGIALALALLVRVCLARFARDVPSRLPFGPLIAVGAVAVLCISVQFSLAF